MWVWRVVAALVAFAVVGTSAPVEARDDHDLLSFWIGQSDVTDRDEETVEGRIEYTSRLTDFAYEPFFGGVGPLAGLMVGGKGSVFGYGGIYGDFFLDPKIVVRPEGAVGFFKPGNAKDLGGVFEIHGALTLAYVFDDGARLGITFAHISNAGTHGSNPGVDSLLLNYAVPIGPLF